MTAIAVLWLALVIDRCVGEPSARWHPVVWMGRWLGATGRWIAPPADSSPMPRREPFVGGAAAWCAGAALVVAAAWGVEELTRRLPVWLGVPFMALLLKPMLAFRMLRDEVQAVEQALSTSIDAGRERLAWLVSRDVRALDEHQVRESAIESLAENLNDSLVAPVFWFVVLGLPGAALYRFANTADAMWGYRGERAGRCWEWAGKWAAHADDVLSWLPARLTALLLVACAPRDAGRIGFATLREEARATPSPNGGWPMGAMARVLGIRLAKPGVYVLHPGGREAAARDTAGALALATRAARALALGAACVSGGLAWLGAS